MILKSLLLFHRLLLILLLSFPAVFSQAQSDTAAILSWELEGEAGRIWDEAEQLWRDSVLPACLKAEGLKLGCDACDRVVLRVVFNIDSLGQTESYHILRENMCGGAFTVKLRECYLSFFLERKWGEALRGKRVETLIGRALKC